MTTCHSYHCEGLKIRFDIVAIPFTFIVYLNLTWWVFKCSGCIISCPDNSFIYNNKTPVCLQQQLYCDFQPSNVVSYYSNISSSVQEYQCEENKK